MKISNKFLGIALSAIAAGALVGCTNELKDTNAQSPPGIRLAKSPDITAWSGNHYFNSDTRGNFMNVPGSIFATRDDNNGTETKIVPEWNWDYLRDGQERHDGIHDWESIFDDFPTEEEVKSMSGAVNLYDPQIDYWELKNNNGGKYTIVYIPSTYDYTTHGSIEYGVGNFEGKFYNFGKIEKMPDITFKHTENIYNAGTIERFDTQTGERHTLVNKGTLEVDTYQNIGYLYNDKAGVLILKGSDPNTQPQFQSDVKIRSLGDVYLPQGALFESRADIHGTVHSKADIKFQGSNIQYMCALKVNGHLDLTAANLHTSYIKANKVSFDGAHIWLMKEAYVEASEFQIVNDGCEVYSYENSYAFLKLGNVLFANSNNFQDTFSPNIYFKVSGNVTIDANKKYRDIQDFFANYDSSARMRYRFQLDDLGMEGGNSQCGGKWTFEGGLIENPETDETCDECGHPEHGYENGEPCEDCKDKPDSPCSPCPNKGVDNSKECDHPNGSHIDGTCKECGENDGCNKKDDSTTDPNNPNNPNNPGGNTPGGNTGNDTPTGGKKSPQSEVEVNLSILDQHDKYVKGGINEMVAKLSIHVRQAGDVKITIPIGAELYCQTDDLFILKDHGVDHFNHGGAIYDDEGNLILNKEQVSYNINGSTVTLTVEYSEGSITITTEGVTEDVFNYLKKEFGDGMNFEVWLYMNDRTKLTIADLKKRLNMAKIEFIDEATGGLPDYYINAFNDTVDNPEGEKDCTVSIVSDQAGNYEGGFKSEHLNGSSWNQIYVIKGKDLPKGVHDHHFLWDEHNKARENK